MSLWQDFLGSEVHFVQGNKYRSRIVEAGRGNAETLVMTHPGGGHLETFAQNVSILGQSIHAVGLEMLWHGFSDAPPIAEDRMEQEAGQVLDVLDCMGIDKAWVHGTASGGVIPTWLAVHHPKRLKGLIYQSTTGGVKVKLENPPLAPQAGGMSLNDHMALLLREPTRERVKERLLHTVHPKNTHLITEELIDIRLDLYQRPETNEAMRSYYAHPTTFSVSEEEIGKIGLPVLVLANDATPQAIAGPQRLASVIPGAWFQVLEQTGLWSHWEAPEAFNNAVLQFITGQGPEPGRRIEG